MVSESSSTPSSSRGSVHVQPSAVIPLSSAFHQPLTTAYHMMPGSSPMSPGSYEKESRKVSSVIISEEFVDQPRGEEIRYVEHEVIEERIIQVPKKEIQYVERRVPKVEIQYNDTIVEEPFVVYKDEYVEVPEIREVIVYKPFVEWVDRNIDVVRTVEKPVIVTRDEHFEVPGKIIEVPKPYVVENKVEVARYVDADVPVVVAQTVKPILCETNEAVDVDVLEYEPEVIAVDIHVAKPVDANLIAAGVVHQQHRVVTVPAGQYNMMMRQLNTHLQDKEIAALPFMQEHGQIPFLRDPVVFEVPATALHIEGYHHKDGSHVNKDHSRSVMSVSEHPSMIQRPRDVSGAHTWDKTTQQSIHTSPNRKHKSGGCCPAPSQVTPLPSPKPMAVQPREASSSSATSTSSSSEQHHATVRSSQKLGSIHSNKKSHVSTIHSDLGSARTHTTIPARTVTGHTTQSGRQSLPAAVGTRSNRGCC